MSEDNVVPVSRRGNKIIKSVPADPNRGPAIGALRTMAHRLGLFLVSSVKLSGRGLTGAGPSKDPSEGPMAIHIGDKLNPFPGVRFSMDERAVLGAIYELLCADPIDKNENFSSSAILPLLEDERGRWELHNDAGHRCAIVVRTGEGARKRYILFYWSGDGWVQQSGAPPYDIPMFGEIVDGRPVLIHEGPKAMEGAIAASLDVKHPLHHVLRRYSHMAWHGSSSGIGVTDWSRVRGAGKVYIWPDMDDVGMENANKVAHMLGGWGVEVAVFMWPDEFLSSYEGWDCADEVCFEGDPRVHVSDYDCPVLSDGGLNPRFMRAVAYDPIRKELLMPGSKYSAFDRMSFNLRYGKGRFERIVREIENRRFVSGVCYRPGVRSGRIIQGQVNCWTPGVRDGDEGKSLSDRRCAIVRQWLEVMIPDDEQREWVLDRAALAVGAPHLVPQHMIVFKGASGTGKSTFMSILCQVVGWDRASTTIPSGIMGNFRDSLFMKQLVVLEEIHDSSQNKASNADKLKELIGNTHLHINRKGMAAMDVPNVINWWGCSNEDAPVTLAHGNDRFYFVDCADVKRPLFFKKWAPVFRSIPWQDAFYKAAIHRFNGLSEERIGSLVGRAPRQKSWKKYEKLSLKPWQSSVLEWIEANHPEDGGAWCFRLDYMLNREHDRFKALKLEELTLFLNENGFVSARQVMIDRVRTRVWCHAEYKAEVVQRHIKPIG